MQNTDTVKNRLDEDLSLAEQYARDGVVCVRNAFDPDFIESLAPIALDMYQAPENYGFVPGITHPRYMARVHSDMRKLVFNMGLGEVSAKVLDSKRINFFFDELFTKKPNSTLPTMWHNDRAGWPVSGQMIPSIWIPLTPIVKENSLECIVGSHRHDTKYWLFSPNGRKMIRPKDRPFHPNVEALRGEEGIEFVRWDMNLGDALFVHPWALHYSSGNPTNEHRIAVSIRVFGDDVRWDPSPECLNIAGACFDEMVPGERPGGPIFPTLWSDGPVENADADYPHGFATTWDKSAYARLKDKQLAKTGFRGLLDEEGGATELALEKILSDIRGGT